MPRQTNSGMWAAICIFILLIIVLALTGGHQ